MSIKFSQSERSTIGIEWELQLIDKDSYDLRQCASAVIEEVERLHPQNSLVHREMLLNTVEVISRPRRNVHDCLMDLQEGINLVRPVISALRVELASAGSHPFANPSYQQVTDSKRYEELVNRTQYWGRQMLLFGTHVHVGVEDRDKVLPIQNYLISKLGHIQALFAASPFWAGVDTGYCDNRAMVFQQLPTAGKPYQFETWEQLEDFTAAMLKTGVINSFDEVRWDIRPSPKFGTIEARVADASSTLKEVAACAALTQALVETASRQLDAGKQLPVLPDWFVRENRWRAARYGIDAVLIEDGQGEECLLTEYLPSWLEELTPAAEDLGCADELWSLLEIVKLGVGYQRQRVIYERTHSYEAVVAFLMAEMKAGEPLDPGHFVDKSLHQSGVKGWKVRAR
ncbi:glutamate--cysteine ligase [Varibaculum vaginae]|uniref:glutamate--cysteine ligase n=1 Tax=Varibaculum vaginae TaxID=2364797 RepID=UPI000F08DC60|nr:glutamate--cysteine ligase [Varibaculum vaginae]